MTNQSKIPFWFPGQPELKDKSVLVLAGDVGGTKTNMALFKATKKNIELVHEEDYHSSKYSSFIDILNQYLSGHPHARPDRLCMGVAGPVFQGKVELTNLSWNLDSEEISRILKIKNVFLINDLEATAYGLAGLGPDDFITIHEGTGKHEGNLAILAPGTGLGEAGVYWDGSYYHPFPTEGGHADFAPRTELDIELYQYLQKEYDIVSCERVIAGPGIYDIYRFLCEIKNRTMAEWLKEAIEKNDPSAVISQSALEEKDATCIETMQLYIRYLARESSNLVLKMKATGGLFLGGGIPPKITSILQQNVFYDNFLDCDRMQNLVRKVPVKIILNSKTALLGAAYYGAYGVCS
ncbi:MAG TPA: glucokinase [Puia sp.]|nr:glucokinase [Puia sp.]